MHVAIYIMISRISVVSWGTVNIIYLQLSHTYFDKIQHQTELPVYEDDVLNAYAKIR